ncbi:MAG TPA: S8 family serine peptidase [Egibacteraceae bacterium]|nr:S8 family serine peptidase [Egibacteraceae bacterium]
MRGAALLVAVTLCAALGSPAPPARAVARAPAADPVPGGLLVTTETAEGADALLAALASPLPPLPGAAARRLTRRVLGVRVAAGGEQAAAEALRALPGVDAVEREGWMRLQRVPDDSRYADQWAHQRTGAEAAWDDSTGDARVRVAVIDSGILGSHPDLAPNVTEDQVSTAGGTATVTGLRVDNDPCNAGHGTFVAGVLGATGDDGLGIAGVAWDVSIVDVSALSAENCDGLADSAILRGLDYALRNPAGPVDVVNMSFGRPADACPVSYHTAIEDLRAAGVVVVAAAGNGEANPDTAGTAMIPASCDGAISVAASRRDDGTASYSSRNPFVDLTAPGGEDTGDGDGLILSTAMDQQGRAGYSRQAGTSHAAPYVSGAAALLRAVEPELTPDQVEWALEQGAKDLARPGRDNPTGWGLVRLDASLALAGGRAGTPEPDPSFPVDETSRPWSPPRVARVAAQGATTAPVSQAVAVSRTLFGAGEAMHAVLAREDVFADALAGSALGNGLGPLLFTGRTGSLAGATRAELLRVLPAGATVYLLGGSAALPVSLEQELADDGLRPVRLSGPSREQTAVAVAQEVDRLRLRAQRAILLARSDQWPDAVAAGSLAAWFGMPVLLTAPTALHPATAAALHALGPDRLYALGGSAAIAPEVLDAAGEAAGVPASERRRLAGPGRAETAVAIASEMEALLREHGDGPPGGVLAVNLRRADGFAHALSASALAGAIAGVMVGVEGTNGQTLADAVRGYLEGFGVDGYVMGGADVVAEPVRQELEALLRG